VQEVHSNFLKIPMEVDNPLEDKFTNISEVVQGFHTNIVDLESCTSPSTPCEERKKRENTNTTIVESINSLDKNV
jgi:hypothetical protein